PADRRGETSGLFGILGRGDERRRVDARVRRRADRGGEIDDGVRRGVTGEQTPVHAAMIFAVVRSGEGEQAEAIDLRPALRNETRAALVIERADDEPLADEPRA